MVRSAVLPTKSKRWSCWRSPRPHAASPVTWTRADVLFVGRVRCGLLEVIVRVEVHVGRAGHKPGQPPAAIRQVLHAHPLPIAGQVWIEPRGVHAEVKAGCPLDGRPEVT